MILVFGSINMDLVMTVRRLPRPGETVLCDGYVTKPGGKGANQAVAAARAGAAVAMAGRVGDDDFGRQLTGNLEGQGIDTGGVRLAAEPTGLAYICVDAEAENFITVASGANLAVRAADVPDAALGPGTTVLMQMEVPPEETWRMIARAAAAGARTILNVAPATSVPRDTLERLDVLIVNELEATAVARHLDLPADAPEASARALAETAGLVCIVTLGAKGAIAVQPLDGGGTTLMKVAAMVIEPVDTTGAGDAFAGILAAGLDGGLKLAEALRRASVGSALACLALGAQESLPTAAAIDARLADVPLPVEAG